jgi:DNA polymerase III subunit gamma/tau
MAISMSYLPFHHKYRPQTFADLVGQEAIASTLTNALRSQKIAPAYLFTGPRGTGKTSSARIFAKSLNCMASEVPTAQPCGKCPTCQSITWGNALDVVEIDAASNTGVDNIREIIDRAQYAPVQCRYKVYLIDECHMLSTAAFNSLLKTLEEPPLHVVFILATTDPQRVLPTIISRCQKFDYRRIPLAAMVQHLTYIAQLEQMQITAGAIQLVAQIAQGGLRDAESLLDQLSLMSAEVTVERVWELVGSVPEKDLLALGQALHHQKIENLLDHCRQLVERGKEPLMILQNLAGFYRDLSIAKAIPNRPDLTNLTTEIWPAVCQLAAAMELPTILASQQQLKDSENQLKGNTQPRLWLEITLLGLMLPVETVVQPVVQPVALATVPPAITASEKPPSAVELSALLPPALEPAPHEPEIPPIDLDHTWQQVLGQLLPSGKGLFAPHGKLLSVAGDVATVSMKSSTFMKLAEGQKQHVQKALTALLARPITVLLQLGAGDASSPPVAKMPAASVSPPTTEVQPTIMAEPPAHRAAVAHEQPAIFQSPEPDPPISTNGNGHRSPVELLETLPEEVSTNFVDLDLDTAAARIAAQFGGEIVEEYVTIWDL